MTYSTAGRLIASIVLSLALVTVFGCGRKVVVGRSIADYPAYHEEAAVQEPAPEQEAAVLQTATEQAPAEQVVPKPAPVKPATPEPQQVKHEAEQAKPPEPAPEQKAAKSSSMADRLAAAQAKAKEAEPQAETAEAKPMTETAEAEPQAETAEAKPKAEATETAAGTAGTSGVPDEAAASERKPTETAKSSRREAPPEDVSSPYILDLSFGGFGLSQGLFDTPVAVAVDEEENIFVVDQGNFRIQKFDRYGLFQFAWGRQGLGDGEFEVVDSGGTRELRMTGIFEFNKPLGILLDTDTTRDLVRITVVDSLNHRLQRFLLTRFEGEPFPDEVFVKLQDGGGNVPDADLKDRYQVERIAVILDPVYINEAKADSLFLTPYLWGGLGFSQGLMNGPSYLAIDDGGILYTSDTGNGRIEGFYVTPDSPSTDTNFYREIGNAIEMDYGAGRLNEPTALVFDDTGYGSFLVLDEKRDGGHVIQRFDKEGEFQGVFAESGGKAGQLRQPVCMAVNKFDNTLFVTDRGHRKVMVYNNKGEFLYSFGGEELSDPRGIAVLRNNYVYVTDAAKNMVYRYVPR